MTIRDMNNYIASLWDWAVLDGCFGNTRIRVSDIDGIVEKNGRFLVLETKGAGVPVNTGQQRMFNAMAASGLFTVVVVWGETGVPQKMRVTTHNGTRVVSVEKPADMEVLRDVVRRWFVYADSMHRTATFDTDIDT